MKRLAWLVVAAVLAVNPNPGLLDGPGVLYRLHVVSVHVRDHAAFDEVFFFFRDVLQLPRVYGEPSRPGQGRKRLYAGFSVGNAYIEPCGPYETDAPFDVDPARFHGLTFTSGLPLPGAARELDASGIAHGGVLPSKGGPSFVYISDPLLAGSRQAISLWELPNSDDPANPQFLAASLEKAGGGVLGVRRMAEVRVGYPSDEVLQRWRTLVAPVQASSDSWALGSGPAIRPVRSKTTGVMSIVLEVESLEIAARALSERRLLGSTSRGRVELDPARTFGLRIELRKFLQEKRQ